MITFYFQLLCNETSLVASAYITLFVKTAITNKNIVMHVILDIMLDYLVINFSPHLERSLIFSSILTYTVGAE